MTLCLVLEPSLDYVEDESFATLRNLGVPASWQVAAIAAGIVLMVIVAAIRLMRQRLRIALLCVGTVAFVTSALWLARPWLQSICSELFNELVHPPDGYPPASFRRVARASIKFLKERAKLTRRRVEDTEHKGAAKHSLPLPLSGRRLPE